MFGDIHYPKIECGFPYTFSSAFDANVIYDLIIIAV